MIRIGFLGVECSHTDAFVKIAKNYDNVKITAICGETPESAENFKKKYNLKCKSVSPEKLADYADAIFVTLRDGAAHKENVLRCARENVAVWINKPFTATVEDAKELGRFLEDNNIIFCAGTNVKYTDAIQKLKKFYRENKDDCVSGILSANIYMNSEYSGMHFYSHHIIESALEIFGTDVESVFAKLNDKSLSVIADFNGINVMFNYALEEAPFVCGIFTRSGSLMEITSYEDVGTAQEYQFNEFLEVVKNKQIPTNVEFYITAVKVSCAIEKSIKENREVSLEEI